MSNDFTRGLAETVRELSVDVAEIRASLRTTKWVITVGLPLVVTAVVTVAVAAWVHQASRLSDVQKSVGNLEVQMAQAVKPFETTARDMNSAAENTKRAAEDMTDAAKAGQNAAESMQTGATTLAIAVRRLEAISAPTHELTELIVLDDTNLKQEGNVFWAQIPFPERVDPGRLREIRARLALSMRRIPGTSSFLLTAQPEGESCRVELFVPPEEVNAVAKYVFEDKGWFWVEVVFVLMAG